MNKIGTKRLEEKEKLYSYLEISNWLWSVSKHYRLQIGLNLIIGILSVGLNLTFVWVTKVAIDIATRTHPMQSLKPAIIALLVLMLLQILLGLATRWIRSVIGIDAQNKLQRDVFEKLIQAKWLSLKKHHTGHLLNCLEIDSAVIVSFLTESIPLLLTTLVQLIGAFFLLYSMDSTLAWLIILVVPFFLMSSKLFLRKMRSLSRIIRNTESNIQSLLQEHLQHIVVLKTLMNDSAPIANLYTNQRKLQREIISKTKYASYSYSLLNLGFSIGYLIAFTWGTVSLHRGLITYGALIAFIQLVGQIQYPVKNLTKFIPTLINVFTASERIMELSYIDIEIKNKPIIIKETLGIKLEGISFKYSKESKSIFNNFSLNIKPGSKVAILGVTGSGKTTLIRLILSLIKPQKGVMELYYKNSRWSINADTRQNFTYVPQGNTLLSGTVKTNLLIGKPTATDKELYEVLKMACADFIFNLPNGLNTVCGELGAGLSEGQAQRISIARALLKDAPILLLDEATSALDEETEKKVLKNITTNFYHKTIIYITHRKEALKYCDKIISLKDIPN